MMHDPSLFADFSEKLSQLIDDQKGLQEVGRALENSAKLVSRIDVSHDIDISRDIGVLVVGINLNNRVSHVPPFGEDWLGAKFIGNKNGIGWIDTKDSIRNIAHVLQLDGEKHLPVHRKLKEGLNSGQISNLVVVHQFLLSGNALNALKELYELTPAEIRLCESLAKGASLNEAANQAQVKVSTTRSHLKEIFVKIGVKSQTELVRILTQISAASAIQEFSRKNKIKLEPDWKNGLVSIQTESFKTRYGTRLTYSKFGDPKGKPVLYFHHGLGARLHSRQMAEAAKQHKLLIYKFDRPGYGHSGILPNMSIKAMGKVTEDLIDHIGVKNIHAIGYGVGARTLLDLLPYTSKRIIRVTLYSFERVKHSKITVMHNLSQVVRERPALLVNLLKIMKFSSSEKSLRNNMIKFYEHSAADIQILQNSSFVDERIKEDFLGGQQGYVGSLFDYKNLRAPLPDFNDAAFDIPIKAIFGSDDIFNNYEDSEPYLGKLPQCQVLISRGDGQLHIEHDFEKFLKSAYFLPVDCSWLIKHNSDTSLDAT